MVITACLCPWEVIGFCVIIGRSNFLKMLNLLYLHCILQDLEALCPASKLLRMTSVVPETADTAALFGTGTTTSQNSTRPYSNNSQPTTIKEPLQKALNDLFHTFTVIAGRDGEVSQQTHFVCKFLQFVVRCGRDRTRLVLQGMPNTLVSCTLCSIVNNKSVF